MVDSASRMLTCKLPLIALIVVKKSDGEANKHSCSYLMQHLKHIEVFFTLFFQILNPHVAQSTFFCLTGGTVSNGITAC